MKILVADDDKLTRTALADILEQEGYEVVAAKDGPHALALFRDQDPDLVCLDIMMPRMSGYDVCREIRRDAPLVPIIFISAKTEEIDRVLGLELGADDYISKPFGVREVVARIRAVTRRCFQLRPDDESLDEFSFGPYTVSRRELAAVSEERRVDLSLREVKLLHCLSVRPGEPISRWELYHECWGSDMPPQSRTLDQHVSRLRKRIEQDPSDPVLIQTVHGYGYRYTGKQ